MRKRIGPRELAAAVFIVGVAVLYWWRPADPPVTMAGGDDPIVDESGVNP